MPPAPAPCAAASAVQRRTAGFFSPASPTAATLPARRTPRLPPVPTARGGEAGQRTTFRIPSRCRDRGVLSPSCAAGAGRSCGLVGRKRRCDWALRCTGGACPIFCSQGGALGVRRNRFQCSIAIEFKAMMMLFTTYRHPTFSTPNRTLAAADGLHSHHIDCPMTTHGCVSQRGRPS